MSKTISLLKAITSLESDIEAKSFLRDLLTEKELREFEARWMVAQMLWQNFSYSEIETRTGMSSTTIARISKWLNQGEGGYKNMLLKFNVSQNSINQISDSFNVSHHNSRFKHRENDNQM